MIAATLVAGTGGSSLPLSCIIVGAVGVSIVSVLLVSETRGKDLAGS